MPENNLSSIGPSYQSYSPHLEGASPEPAASPATGGACGGSEGGMSVDPDQFYEDGTGLTNTSYELNAGVPDYLLADEGPAAAEAPATEDAPADDDPHTTFRGNAQQGHLSARRAANEGAEGGSGVSAFNDPPSLDQPGGGKVIFVDGSVGALLFSAGVQGAIVFDEECGMGLVASADESLSAEKGPKGSSKPGASVVAGVAVYEGSFDDYDKATEVEAFAGDGLAGSGRVYVDGEGRPIGAGAGIGLGVGVGLSIGQSSSTKYFPDCPEK